MYLTECARDLLLSELTRLAKRIIGVGSKLLACELRYEEIGKAFLGALLLYDLQPYPRVITLFLPMLDIAHELGEGSMTN